MHFLAIILCVTLPVTQALNGHVEKRSDEAIETVVMQLTEELNQVKARQAADLTRLQTQLQSVQSICSAARRHVAFLAQFSSHLTTIPQSGPLIFDHVVFNDGNSYDSGHGIFTAPFSGVYLFSAKVFTGEQETSRPAVDVVLNGAVVDRLAFDYVSIQSGHGGDSHSMATVLRLKEGDRVWLAGVQGNIADQVYGDIHTSFSGASLYVD